MSSSRLVLKLAYLSFSSREHNQDHDDDDQEGDDGDQRAEHDPFDDEPFVASPADDELNFLMSSTCLGEDGHCVYSCLVIIVIYDYGLLSFHMVFSTRNLVSIAELHTLANTVYIGLIVPFGLIDKFACVVFVDLNLEYSASLLDDKSKAGCCTGEVLREGNSQLPYIFRYPMLIIRICTISCRERKRIVGGKHLHQANRYQK